MLLELKLSDKNDDVSENIRNFATNKENIV